MTGSSVDAGDEQPDPRVHLLETMIAIGYADGDFAAVERDRVIAVARFLGLAADDHAHIERLLAADTPPPLPTTDALPDYHTRCFVYQYAVDLALADGVVHDHERAQLAHLATLWQLSDDDVAAIWRGVEAIA